MRLVTSGTTPQTVHTWKSAVRVPNEYRDTCAGDLTVTDSDPEADDVQTPPCLTQNEHEHARAGISVGSGAIVNAKEIFPQWQRPAMSMIPPTQRSESCKHEPFRRCGQ